MADHGSQTEVSTLQVLVHNFSWCSCGQRGNHVKIRTSQRPVEAGQAIALSYGIGDFDRQKRIFGHTDGATSVSVELEFGGEWEIQGLMNAFVALSEKHGAIWFDQLSIPQDPALIPIHLQKMPQIYDMFEVVVLLPNAPCPCLRDTFSSWTEDKSFADRDGDFDLYNVASECLNAFPVSAYNFRLWTKQEFAYATKISVTYCGSSGNQCSRGSRHWLYRTSRIPTTEPGRFSRWALGKYESCFNEAQRQSNNIEDQEHIAWSILRDAYVAGRDHMIDGIHSFYLRADLEFAEQNLNQALAQVARFILGDGLSRQKSTSEDLYLYSDLNSEHLASAKEDFALAVFPAIRAYRVPQECSDLTLPELVEDGLEQYERYFGSRAISKLPKGLFQIGADSMRCQPSIYLRTDKVHCLGDVYGALQSDIYRHIAPLEQVMLHLRDGSDPPASRMASSKTYTEAFANCSSGHSLKFMRRVSKIRHQTFGRSRVGALESWAGAILREDAAAPLDKWPSPAHEKAIFEASLHTRRPWGSWPEIDHERVCYDLMCDYACIHPEIAREKGLGLIVKTEDPPCIGFVNAKVYDGMKAIEQYRRTYGAPSTELRTRDNDVFPEDWVTVMVSDPKQSERFLTVEAMLMDGLYDLGTHMENMEFQGRRFVPKYLVLGVWFHCERDDPCVGAELASHSTQDCNAVLC